MEFRKRKHVQLAYTGDFLETDEAYFPPMGETDIEADVLQFIHNEMEKLPGQTRRIFKLFYVEGKSVGEIAGDDGAQSANCRQCKTYCG